MSIPRLFTDASLAEGEPVPATPGQAHYLGGVMRRGAGDPVALFNGRDGEWAARIESIRKDRAVFLPERRTREQETPPQVTLLVAALKRDALDLIAEKATELGATRIQPVFTRRSVADRVNTDRLSTIAREAAEQCERLSVPTVSPAAALHAVLDAWDHTVPLILAAERRNAPPIGQAAACLSPPYALLIGPEGGFDRAELDDLTRRPFVAPAALGPRILRAETAALAGLAVLQAVAGDWT